MTHKLRKLLMSQKGFTLVELMTVLIILAIVLAVGIPKYLQLQAKSGWEADANTIDNFAKAAEAYAASINKYNIRIPLQVLIDDGLIDGSTILNRMNRDAGTNNLSEKNKGALDKDIKTLYGKDATHGKVFFSFNEKTGNVNNRASVIQHMIGNPPYGEGPQFATDTAVNKTEWENEPISYKNDDIDGSETVERPVYPPTELNP